MLPMYLTQKNSRSGTRRGWMIDMVQRSAASMSAPAGSVETTRFTMSRSFDWQHDLEGGFPVIIGHGDCAAVLLGDQLCDG